jgi:predicted nucleic acid-binding protein
MARSGLVDAAVLVALLSRRDAHHQWASAQATAQAPPWSTCEAALSEAFHLLGTRGLDSLAAMLRRKALLVALDLREHLKPVLALMEKYADLPVSLADACLVRMSETLSDPLLLTTDSDFHIYRRHGRQVIPAIMPT